MGNRNIPNGTPGDKVRLWKISDVICCGSEIVARMAVEQGASPVISNVFLADLSHEMENDGVETGRNSPHLSMQSLNELESSEKSGIPLNSAWTLWHDK